MKDLSKIYHPWCATATVTKRKHPNSRSNALFINHNWITAVALDKMLECIVVEAYAVKKEMKAWGLDTKDVGHCPNYEAPSIVGQIVSDGRTNFV